MQAYQQLDFEQHPNVLMIARVACNNLMLFGPPSHGGGWDLKEKLVAFHTRKQWILAAAAELERLSSLARGNPEGLESAASAYAERLLEAFSEAGLEGEYFKYECGSAACGRLF
jgi:hypothetical protein